MTARCVVIAVALLSTGCLPYPVQSPRVEPGLTFAGEIGGRIMVRDSASARPILMPEVALSPSLGFARADSSGAALRVGGTLGLPGPWAGDVYGQLPRAGAFVAGAGAMVSAVRTTNGARYAPALPYASFGLETGKGEMLSLSAAMLTIHRVPQPGAPNGPEPTVTSAVLVAGLHERSPLDFGEGSSSEGVFIAVFLGNHGVESISGFENLSVPLRSVVIVGFSFDAVRPWSSFNGPSAPPRRRPPR